MPSASATFAGNVRGDLDSDDFDQGLGKLFFRKMSDCKKRLHYKMPHKTSEGETFTINYHFDPSVPIKRWDFIECFNRIIFVDQRYEAWEVAQEASARAVSFENGMKRKLLAVVKKANNDDQLRLRVKQLLDDALLRFGSLF